MRGRRSPRRRSGKGASQDDIVSVRCPIELVDRDYILSLPDSSIAGDEEYVFKHNLEREALVSLTPTAARRTIMRHRRMDGFPRRVGGRSEEHFEMLARHREKAGATAVAAISYLRAADVARSRYAAAKAAELYRRVLPSSRGAISTTKTSAPGARTPGRRPSVARSQRRGYAPSWRCWRAPGDSVFEQRRGGALSDRAALSSARSPGGGRRHFTAALALVGQAHDERGVAYALEDIGKLHWLKGDYALALEYTLRSLACVARPAIVEASGSPS